VTLRAHLEADRDGFRLEANVDAGEGQTLALLGPNGAGKTTAVLALAGLIPSTGRIELDGEPLEGRPPERRPLGIAFQGGLLFPHLSPLANVAFPLEARGVPRRRARLEAAAVMDRLAPAVRREAKPSSLSGGEAQRVALARAIVHHPRLLLLDEPSSGLDIRSRAEMRPVLRDTLASFPGVRILVTHDPTEAIALADRVVILEGGRVTQAGTFDDVRREPRTRYAADLIGVNVFVGRLEPVDGGGRLVAEDGEVEVAWPEGLPRAVLEDVVATLRPSDVVVHTREPTGGSARNRARGSIRDIAVAGERARLRIATHPELVAELTVASVRRLGLSPGVEVWTSFKAVEVEIATPSTARPAAPLP
jgi:molybdate transport system ATP-binding protein